MQQESKIGFLWQYVIACIHPSQYKELIKKKKGAFVGYVAVLVMFLVLIENVIPFAAWTAVMWISFRASCTCSAEDGECRWFRKSGFKPYPEVYFRKRIFSE